MLAEAGAPYNFYTNNGSKYLVCWTRFGWTYFTRFEI